MTKTIVGKTAWVPNEKKKLFSHISHCYLNSIPKRHSFLPSFYTSPLFYVKQELLYRIRKSEEEREKRIIHCGEALPRGSGIDPRLRLSHAPSTNLADGLQPLAVFIVAGQQEAPVAAGPPPPAQVGTDHHKIQGVTQAVQVVLLQLGGGKAEDEGGLRVIGGLRRDWGEYENFHNGDREWPP